MSINTRTQLYGIFGNPVRHSLSPVMHNAAIAALKLNAVYCAFEPDSIEEAVKAFRSLKLSGVSVTIPFKETVLPFLDELDESARRMGAANTIVSRNGKLIGYNTDGIGAVRALQSSETELSGQRVLILGNGGSARAVCFALLDQGAQITVAGRNPDRTKAFSESISAAHGSPVHYMAIETINPEIISSANILINTTPVGMSEHRSMLPIAKEFLMPHLTVFDIVYSPHETLLLRTAKERGCKTVFGIDMLIYQGIEQFKLWFNVEPPFDFMKKAVMPHLL